MTVSYNSDFTPRYNTLYLIINHLSNWYYTKYLENLWKIILPVKLGLKGRSMRKSIVLLLPSLHPILLLGLGLWCLLFSLLTSNLLTCQLVTLSTKETFFCYSVFIFPPSFVSLLLCLYFILSLFFCYPVLILLCLKVV